MLTRLSVLFGTSKLTFFLVHSQFPGLARIGGESRHVGILTDVLV